MKIVVVAGGSGFIGSHLCETLLAAGNRVICVDNFLTGRKENVAHLLQNNSFTLLEHDITQPIKIDGLVDQVYNLASPASPKDFLRIPFEILAVNSTGTGNMLQLAAEKKARFLQASTSEVYGDPLQHPQKESYWGNVNPIGDRSCYDESKRFSETITMAFNRKKGLETRIARIFNTFGPRMRSDDGRAVPSFISSALQNKPITVFGDGSQTRSFCFVSDLVDGLIRLMNSSYAMPVNLGNPNEISILQLAEKIKEIAGSKSRIVFAEPLQDDPSKRKPDISLAIKQLGWQPKVSLEEGLKKTIKWFKENQ
jgi:nucleoside-diphosphate-sugar epimerase